MADAKQLAEALRNVRACLVSENEKRNGPICDTIWYGNAETLFDYIDNTLAAHEAQAALAAEPAILNCEIQPRPLSHPLTDYHRAISEGPLHYTWQDKPHRLVYGLIAAVRFYAAPVAQAEPWQPIETAPKDGSGILVTAAGFSYAVEWSDEFDWWCVDDNKLGPFRLRGQAPTHWMPLPQPPKEQQHG